MVLFAVSVVSMACGDPGVPSTQGTQATKVFNVVCYAGDKPVVKVDGATNVTLGTNGYVRYTSDKKNYGFLGTCSFEEK